MIWTLTNRADITVARLADSHYSRQTIGSRQFSPPGQVIVLRLGDDIFRASAGWVWHRPAQGKASRMDGYDGFYNCSFFRNESPILSSVLIQEAIQWALKVWGNPVKGFDTYVWPAKIKSSNPGYCYLQAGWLKDGWSKDGLKRRLYKMLI